MTAPMVRMCGEVLRVKRDSSLSVLYSLTLDTAVAAFRMEGVEMDLSLDTRLVQIHTHYNVHLTTSGPETQPSIERWISVQSQLNVLYREVISVQSQLSVLYREVVSVQSVLYREVVSVQSILYREVVSVQRSKSIAKELWDPTK